MALAYKPTLLDGTEPALRSYGLAASYYTAGNLLLTVSSMARDNCGLSKWSSWALLKGKAHEWDITTKSRFTAWEGRKEKQIMCGECTYTIGELSQKNTHTTCHLNAIDNLSTTQDLYSMSTGKMKTWLFYKCVKAARRENCIYCLYVCVVSYIVITKGKKYTKKWKDNPNNLVKIFKCIFVLLDMCIQVRNDISI